MDNGRGMAEEVPRWEEQSQTVARRVRVPRGYGFAAGFLWLARPSVLWLWLSLLLVVPGLLLRGYAAGYVRKNMELTQTGPYAYTRNPLYLGSMLTALGFTAASRQPLLFVLLLALFAFIYLPVIRSEERFLRTNFAEFDRYAARVPRLLPRLTATHGASRGEFSPERYRRHREYNSVMGAAAIYAALLVLMVLRTHVFKP